MEPVGSHGLACLGEEDYAATALYMQDQAQVIDAQLNTINTQLTAYTTRLSLYATSAASTSLPAGVGQIMPDGRAADAVSFAGGTVSGGGATVTLSGSLITFTVPQDGWYDIGAYASMTPAGVINAGSERVLYLQFLETPSNAFFPLDRLYQWRTTETNTGGEFVEVSGLVFMEAGRTATLRMLVSHTNVGSNLVIAAGAKVWVAYQTRRGQVIVSA